MDEARPLTPFRELYWQSHDRLRLHARIYDAPDPSALSVLCLASLRRNCRDFEDIAPRLQRRYHVIAPDLRGRGLSARDRHPTNYQPNVYLHDLLNLLSQLGVHRVAVLGIALGGILGMMLAQAQSGLVRALILDDIGPEVDAAGGARVMGLMQPRAPVRDWAEATARLQERYATAWPNLSAARWQALTRRTYREDSQGRVTYDCDPRVAEVNNRGHAATSDLWPLWQSLTPVPTLCIRGARSEILSEAVFARMLTERPVEALSVPGRGHFPLLDEPGVGPVIDEFLARQLTDKPILYKTSHIQEKFPTPAGRWKARSNSRENR